MPHPFPVLSAEEAAAHIPHGAFVGFSGFTPAGAAKAVPRALAARARALHAAGEPYRLRVLTGASTGDSFDEALAEADAVSWRAPYQSSRRLRQRINAGETEFVDMHLSHVPQMLEFGFFGAMDWAVVEATEVTSDGRVYLTTSVGVSPSVLRHARHVVIEVNQHPSRRLPEMHDVAVLPPPPHRSPIPIYHPLSRMGVPFATVDPAKVVGVVQTDEPDDVAPFSAPDAVSQQIAGHVIEFLLHELRAGRIPPDFLPLQSGVGNVANAVMHGLGEHPEVPPFAMYTEVFQDALVDLMEAGRLTAASTCALTLSPPQIRRVYDRMDVFAPRIVLRPQELTNNPGVVRRLGVITLNTALEADVYGNANSTHVAGTQMVNGIGGSGDYTRNGYLSFLVTPSLAKGGAVSAIVPMVSHVDHNEHSVQVLVTEQGLADLRGLGPMARAAAVIENCAHPSFRDLLRDYVRDARPGHTRHDLGRAFALHQALAERGTMRPAAAPAA